MMRLVPIFLICAVASGAGPTTSESFDRDPKWEAFANHPAIEKFPTVVQDFGYKDGAIGGQVWRSSTPAWYAAKIDVAMDRPLSINATFKIARTGSSSGALLGFFNSADVPLAGRPKQSLAFYFGGRRDDAIVHIRTYNGDNEGAGSPVPPSVNKRVAPGIPADGSVHHLTMTYDPAGKKISAQLDDLPVAIADCSAFNSAGVHFDRFGLLNMLKSGGPMNILFTSLKFNDVAVDLSKDPQWESHGNHVTFEDHDPSGTQAYGFSQTKLAGGKVGELGGTLWRSPKPSFYGDRVGPFSMDDALHAEGTVCMTVGTPDSGVLLGFFNADSIRAGEMKNFVGVQIEGPTRVGHFFRPYVLNSAGTKITTNEASRLVPDSKAHRWNFSYDPAANGTLSVTIDDKTSKIVLPAKLRAAGAKFDHFGLLSNIAGGNQVRIYIDDVTYTHRR